MRIAVAVPEIIEYDMRTNFRNMLSLIDEAGQNGVELILFPEAFLTGLIICDDYHKDKIYAIDLSSDCIAQIKEKAASGNVWIAFGFLEIEDGIIYDSAILINNTGEIALHYKRMSPGWCSGEADSGEYGYGKEYSSVMTPWGKVGFLICGDLFQTERLAVDAKLDLLLFPFARCFSPSVQNFQWEWDNVEWKEYAKQVGKVDAYTLMSNYIAPYNDITGGGFGGGFITDRSGNLLASLPLNKAGLIVHDLDIRERN